MIDKEFEKLPNNIDIERIRSYENETIGYYVRGHWRRNSVAIAVNLDFCEEYEYSAFRHGYMRKVPCNEEFSDFQLIVCARGRGAFPVTYSWD